MSGSPKGRCRRLLQRERRLGRGIAGGSRGGCGGGGKAWGYAKGCDLGEGERQADGSPRRRDVNARARVPKFPPIQRDTLPYTRNFRRPGCIQCISRRPTDRTGVPFVPVSSAHPSPITATVARRSGRQCVGAFHSYALFVSTGKKNNKNSPLVAAETSCSHLNSIIHLRPQRVWYLPSRRIRPRPGAV